VVHEPQKLTQLNQELLRSCIGGDYAQNELDELRAFMKEENLKITNAAAERQAAVTEVTTAQNEAIGGIEKFQQRYQECCQDLSLRDGLGKKYGAPRRNAQEKIRSEMSRSDGQAQKITTLLKEVTEKCTLLDGAADSKQVRFAGDKSSGDVVLQLFQNLIHLRGLLHSRAVYLNFLAEDGHPILIDKEVALGAVFPDATIRPPPAILSSTPFMEKVITIEMECKTDTRGIYEKEGKLSELGDDEVPESLQAYLEEQRAKATTYETTSCRQLRAQTEELTTLCVQVSRAILGGIVGQCEETIASRHQTMVDMLKAELAKLENEKVANKKLLRPQLADKNAATELQALREAEAVRLAKTLDLIAQSKVQFPALL
jgi:hypothetical protein